MDRIIALNLGQQLPTAAQEWRGKIIFLPTAEGDRWYVCVDDGNQNCSWVQIAPAAE